MPDCMLCAKTILKRPNETAGSYGKRKFCGLPCSIKGRKLGIIGSPVGEGKLSEIDQRVNSMKTGGISHAILNPAMVREIREMRRPLGFNSREIAEYKGLKQSTVDAVLSGKTWSHVT